MIEGVIYRYKSPRGKYYIGQTIDEVSRRRNFLNSSNKYGGTKIDRARKKYGPENFEYCVLMKVEGDNPEEVKNYLNILEIYFIKQYDSINNGYNLTEGGDGTVGYKHSEEWKQSFSQYLQGNKFNLGKKRSDESKKKTSVSLKGKKRSDESKQKNREAHIGKEPWNKGLFGWKKNKPISEESRMNYVTAAKKRGISDETRKKINESNRGRHRVYNPDGTYRMVK